MEAGGMCELSIISNQFCCGPKTAIKNSCVCVCFKGRGGFGCFMLELYIGVIHGPWVYR